MEQKQPDYGVDITQKLSPKREQKRSDFGADMTQELSPKWGQMTFTLAFETLSFSGKMPLELITSTPENLQQPIRLGLSTSGKSLVAKSHSHHDINKAKQNKTKQNKSKHPHQKQKTKNQQQKKKNIKEMYVGH